MLEKVLEDGLAELDPARQVDFVRVLRFSLTLNPLSLMSEDWKSFGFSRQELYDLKVILLRPLACEFLQSQGIVMRRGTFDRKTSQMAYHHRYGRAPSLIHLKPPIMALSYAEWLDLATDGTATVAVPVALQEFGV
ncbi:MAG: hypothetical protein MUE40_18175 [Anaerolineae bacterium]|jgi:hypothetical protein|nr:hypothetical protein [Anaerolineae bacterium]